MSAERLAVGDRVHCHKCRQWHPTEQPASGSATDYATQMLFYRCGTALFYAGQIGSTARDPKAVKSPLELELWRVTLDGRILSCDLRCDAAGWDVVIRSDREAPFSRRCVSEDEARCCAHALHQDHLVQGWTDASG